MSSDRLRIALLHHTVASPLDGPVVQTARGLRAEDHDVRVLSSHRHRTKTALEDGLPVTRLARLPEAPLRYRGFTGPLTHAPAVGRALARGGYDVVQAYSPEDAWIALWSRRRTGVPVVFSAAEPLTRDRLADRRLRLRAVQAAVEESDAVTAPSEELAAIASRWLAVDAEVLEPGDAAAHERLYRRLTATRTR